MKKIKTSDSFKEFNVGDLSNIQGGKRIKTAGSTQCFDGDTYSYSSDVRKNDGPVFKFKGLEYIRSCNC